MSGRTVVRYVIRAIGVLVVIVLAAGLCIRIYGAHKLAVTQSQLDLKLGNLTSNVTARVPDEHNATIPLRAGSEAIVISAEDKTKFGGVLEQSAIKWTPAQREDAQRVLDANHLALEILRRAGSLKHGVFTEAAPASRERRQNPYLKLLKGQQLLKVDARLALLDRDYNRLFADVASMEAMANAFEYGSSIVNLAFGFATERIMLDLIHEVVSEQAIDRGTLSQLAQCIPATDMHVAFRRALASERARRDETWERAIREDLEYGGGPWYMRWHPYRLLNTIFRAQGYQSVLDFVDAMDQPYGTNPRWSSLGSLEPTGVWNIFLRMSYPAYFSAAVRCQCLMSARRTAKLALTLRVQATDTGSYPDSLAALPDASQPDPFTGGPIKYERNPDGSGRVDVPGAPALFERSAHHVPNHPQFTWDLPAITPPVH